MKSDEGKAEKSREMEKIAIIINALQERFKMMEQQANMLESYTMEQQMLKENLDDIRKAEKEQEILVPLGRDVFLQAALKKTDDVLMSVGAKVVVKKSIDEVKIIAEKNKERFFIARQELEQEMERIAEEIERLSDELRRLQEER